MSHTLHRRYARLHGCRLEQLPILHLCWFEQHSPAPPSCSGAWGSLAAVPQAGHFTGGGMVACTRMHTVGTAA